MIHEGPLLEYAGRDLAYLQWAAAARHWIVLVLAARAVPPAPGPFAAQLAVPRRRRRRCSCVALACDRDGAGEDADPARARCCSARAAPLCLLGLASWLAGGGA